MLVDLLYDPNLATRIAFDNYLFMNWPWKKVVFVALHAYVGFPQSHYHDHSLIVGASATKELIAEGSERARAREQEKLLS